MPNRQMIDGSNNLRGGLLGRLFSLVKKLFSQSFGGRASEMVTATAWTGGDAYAVQFVTETTPTTFTVANGTGTYSGVTYPSGLIFYGDITAITPGASESVIIYKK